MSPIPYVRAQVIALAGLVAAAGLFDAAILAVCCGIGALLWLLLMHQKYQRDLRITGGGVPPHRAQLDRVVMTDTLVAVLPATLFASAFLLGSAHPLAGRVAIHGATSALTPAALAIWGSSLVDWYLILPRISGQLGPRPCRAALEVASFPWPGTWKEVTRWWYVHRIIAAFAFRVGLSTALAVVIGEISGLHQEARWFAGVAMLLFSGYAISTLARGVDQVGHAKAIVGETVRVDRRAGRRRKWRFWSRLPPLQLDDRYYVVDIAIESVQLVSADVYERPALPSPEKFARHPQWVSLANIDAIRQEQSKFSGCAERCSGVNWYCLQNPRCFEPK